jgi:hypothetical protein
LFFLGLDGIFLLLFHWGRTFSVSGNALKSMDESVLSVPTVSMSTSASGDIVTDYLNQLRHTESTMLNERKQHWMSQINGAVNRVQFALRIFKEGVFMPNYLFKPAFWAIGTAIPGDPFPYEQRLLGPWIDIDVWQEEQRQAWLDSQQP